MSELEDYLAREGIVVTGPDDYYTEEEAMQRLGWCNVVAFQRVCCDKDRPLVRVKTNAGWRVPVASVEAELSRRATMNKRRGFGRVAQADRGK